MTINVEEYLKELKEKEEREKFLLSKIQDCHEEMINTIDSIKKDFDEIREYDKLIKQKLSELSDCQKNHKHSSPESDTSCSVSA